MPPKVLKGIQVAVGLAVLVCLVLLVRSLDFALLLDVLRRTSWVLVGAVVVLNFAAAFCRVGYWWLVLKPMGRFSIRDTIRLTFAALAGNLIAPARAGDVFKIWQLKRLFDVAVPVSVAAVGFEKLGEAVAMFALLIPLPWLVPTLPGHMEELLKFLPAVLVASVLVTWLLVRRSAHAGARWLLGLSLLRSPLRVAIALACFLGVWSLDVAQIWLLLTALGISGPAGGVGSALLVLFVVNLAIVIPVSPGNLGTHELGSVTALTLLGVPMSSAVAFALLYHATQTLPLTVAGLPNLRTLLAGQRLSEVRV